MLFHKEKRMPRMIAINRHALPLFALTLVAIGTASQCAAGTKIYVGQTWPAAQLIPMDNIRHDGFDELLNGQLFTLESHGERCEPTQ